jgi:hypothetical protein
VLDYRNSRWSLAHARISIGDQSNEIEARHDSNESVVLDDREAVKVSLDEAASGVLQ